MKSYHKSFAHYMRYIVFLMILAFISVLMLFMSGSSRPFEEVEQSVEGALDGSGLTKQDNSRLKRNFGLNAADYEGVLYYSAESNISADEVILIKVSDEKQTAQVVDAINERTDARIEDFESYLPEEAQLLQDARQSVRGDYIFYAVSSKADQYLNTFNKSL